MNNADIVHGIEDACSDDALWLVSSVVEYIKETGEFGLVDEKVTYADGGEDQVQRRSQRNMPLSVLPSDLPRPKSKKRVINLFIFQWVRSTMI